jgi:flagellar basal-body rod modification protein FlgD
MPYTPGINDATGPVIGAASRDISEVNKLDFMNLLVAQIQHQDPLSPMDNAEFTGQITQFTMLEELQGLAAKMDENVLMSQSINNTAMLALVGKNVTVEGDTTRVTDGVATETVVVTAGPGTAEVTVTDSGGNVVRTYKAPVSGGLSAVSWDGLDDDGEAAVDGEYTVSVSVTNSGKDLPVTTLMTAPVEGLRYENNIAVVMVNGREYFVSDIYKVS